MFTSTQKVKALRTHETEQESQRSTEVRRARQPQVWEPRAGVIPQPWSAVTVAKELSYNPAGFKVGVILNHTGTHCSRGRTHLKCTPKPGHEAGGRYTPRSQTCPFTICESFVLLSFFSRCHSNHFSWERPFYPSCVVLQGHCSRSTL